MDEDRPRKSQNGEVAVRARLEPWQIYLGFGIIATTGYFASLGQPPVRATFYTLIGLSAVGMVAWRVFFGNTADRIGWMLIGVGLLFYFLGDATYSVYRFFLHLSPPYPGVADIFFLLSRIPLTIGLFRLATRGPKHGFSLLDSTILSVGLLMLWWTLLMAPLAYNGSYTSLGRIVAIAYPALDFLMLSVGIRVAMNLRRVTLPVLLLGVGLASLLVTDVIYTVLQLTHMYHVGTPLDLGWIGFYLMIGASALARPNDRVEEDKLPKEIPNYTLRLVLLFIAAELFPLAEAINVFLRRGSVDPILIVLGAGLIALVMVDMQRLMKANLALQAELAKIKSDVLFRSIVERSYSGVSQFGASLVARYHSPNMRAIADIDSITRDFRDIVHPDDLPKFNHFWLDSLEPDTKSQSLEYRLKNQSGDWVDVESVANNLLSDEWIHGVVLITRDISVRKDYERTLERMAFEDYLTKLQNRAGLRRELEQILEDSKESHKTAGVLYLDLDNFGDINGTFGHTAGDEILIQVGRRLRKLLYAGEYVARVGGDEFIVASPNLHTANDAGLTYQRLSAAWERPFEVGPYQILMSASTGIAMTQTKLTAEELVRNADLALRRAKSDGPGIVRIFNQELLEENRRQHRLSRALRDLLTGDAGSSWIEIKYLPTVRLNDGKITGFEVDYLLKHPEYGEIRPDELVDVAFESDLLFELEQRILIRTCETLQAWMGAGITLPVAGIHISAASFRRPNFENMVSEILAKYRLDPSSIRLQIDESELLLHDAIAGVMIGSLAELGIEVVIDHFARNYSSITLLQRVPHASLKLDRVLAGNIYDRDTATIVRGIVRIAHDLRRTVIADDLDTEAQVAAARRIGCDEGQGRYFSKPLTSREMRDRFSTWHGLPPDGSVTGEMLAT